MPAFAFTARSIAGKPVQGLRVVDSEAALAPALALEGLFLVRAEPAAPRRARGKVRHRPKDLPLFLVHLTLYLESGLPLLTALQDYRDPDRPWLEAVAQDMALRLGEGAQLSELMAAHPGLFLPVHVGMVKAGEATGRLDQALRAMIRLVEWNQGFRIQVRKAATYPLILVAVLALVILVASIYSLPPILKLMEGLGVPLPLVTRLLLAVGRGLSSYAWLGVLPLAGYFAVALALRQPRFRLVWDTALLELPLAGPLLARLALARFARFFAAQYRAGLPLVQALRSSEGVTGNARLGLGLRRMRLAVEQGVGLAAAAARAGYMPQLIIRMLALGEETGQLEETLERAALLCDAEVEEGVRLFFAVLDPVLKLAMACLLVFVAAAVLLPLYTLIGGING